METMNLVIIIALLNVGISSSRYLLLQLNNTSPWEDRIEKHESGQKDFNSNVQNLTLTNRIVNSVVSKNEYPWLVWIERRVIIKTPAGKSFEWSYPCAGGIISSNLMVLTAGHCICSFYDFETDGLRSTRNCKPNPENPSLKKIGKQFNQQTPNNDKIPKNHISMKVGNKDIKKGTVVRVLGGYAMETKFDSSKPPKVVLKDGIDIGLIVPRPEDIHFFRDLKLRALRIPKPSEEQTLLNKIVKLVGWGVIYDESWKNGEKMQHSTSCMTTNEAPDGDMYKPCKIDWLRQNLIDSKGKFSCEKQKYPPDLPPEQECEKWLKQAETLVPEDKKEEFKRGAMIKITEPYLETYFECFKREKWEAQHGWCETEQSTEKSKHWGFCSPSCQYFHSGSETEKKVPDVHHEVKKIIRKQKDCPSQIFINPSNLCLDTIFPDKIFWNFKIDWEFDKLTYQEPLIINWNSDMPYAQACQGDSGLPVVLDKERPETVFAVYVAGSDSNIAACGVLPGSKGIAEKLTHPVVNFWINNFQKI